MGKKRVVKKSEEEVKQEAKKVAEKKAKQVSKGVKRKKVNKGKVYVRCSYNNTHITVADMEGNVIAWMSAGTLGFSGPKKATPFAASKVAEAIAEKLSKTGPFDVEVYVKGIGAGRDQVLRTLNSKGFNVVKIADITPIPHNGPRPPKSRRV